MITREFFDEEGDRYYESFDGKVWCADIFDRMFFPKKLEVITKSHTIAEKQLRPQRK